MKTRKLTALLLALCMLLSLSISAFAADDAIASGTIQDSKITWKLDDKGWLTISGSGDCSAFASKDDQPWAEYRSQITQVWFDGMESLAIPDLAYWFEDCTNLTTAEIPSTTPVIGRHAFYNCPLLTKLSIYYGEYMLNSIGENAFWRETDNGDTLYVAYIIGYPDSSVPFHDYDWTASNRSNRYFYDLYGVYQNADAGSAATNGIKKAPAVDLEANLVAVHLGVGHIRSIRHQRPAVFCRQGHGGHLHGGGGVVDDLCVGDVDLSVLVNRHRQHSRNNDGENCRFFPMRIVGGRCYFLEHGIAVDLRAACFLRKPAEERVAPAGRLRG